MYIHHLLPRIDYPLSQILKSKSCLLKCELPVAVSKPRTHSPFALMAAFKGTSVLPVLTLSEEENSPSRHLESRNKKRLKKNSNN